jgi:[amino group carrier protein]-6-phospho-L-2-aminoadipate/5-phospho-L-glutamate reductase
MRVGIWGGSGFVGGELLRILLRHPDVEVTYVASKEHEGEYIHRVHPHLRGISGLVFGAYDAGIASSKCDALFVAVPFKQALQDVPRIVSSGIRLVDLSPAYRLRNPDDYLPHYKIVHPQPTVLADFVYGLPEVNRNEIKGSTKIANPGCLATAALLAVKGFVETMEQTGELIIDAKVGSSGSGSKASPLNTHAVRYGVVRAYKLGNHRHSIEISSYLCNHHLEHVHVSFSAHGVNMVRGILVTAYLTLKEPLSEGEVWKILRQTFAEEPFIRFIKDRSGGFRLPDPKLTLGSNFCDIGFELLPDGRHLILVSALDNLVKGAAGNAVQCFNLMNGIKEDTGLNLIPIYPA